MTKLLILANWKSKSYNSILVIIHHLTKMVDYKLVKVTIIMPGLEKVIIDMVRYHHNISIRLSQIQAHFLYKNSGLYCDIS